MAVPPFWVLEERIGCKEKLVICEAIGLPILASMSRRHSSTYVFLKDSVPLFPLHSISRFQGFRFLARFLNAETDSGVIGDDVADHRRPFPHSMSHVMRVFCVGDGRFASVMKLLNDLMTAYALTDHHS
jgi:hypothetical protein